MGVGAWTPCKASARGLSDSPYESQMMVLATVTENGTALMSCGAEIVVRSRGAWWHACCRTGLYVPRSICWQQPLPQWAAERRT